MTVLILSVFGMSPQIHPPSLPLTAKVRAGLSVFSAGPDLALADVKQSMSGLCFA